MDDANRPVQQTERISFDEACKTFRLYAGSSMYSFCITPELSLEHLYWGPRLQAGYDLRYLGESARMAHFDTVEAAPTSFEGRIVLQAENIEEIEKLWRENRTWTSSSADEADYLQRRRLENYSWRIMNKVHQQELRDDKTKEKDRDKAFRKSFSLSFDAAGEPTPSPLKSVGRTPGKYRRRSIAATSMADPLIDLGELSAMSKLLASAPTSPSLRILEELSATRSQARGTSRQIFDRKLGKIGKSTLCVEYSDHGTGDFRTPSLIVVDNYNGSAISPLKYCSHAIYRGKLPMLTEHMPGVRCNHAAEASTLVVTMHDAGTGLDVDLVYVAMHDYDCITRRAIFRNNKARDAAGGAASTHISSKVIQKASSLTIDFESPIQPFHMVQLSGSWARERYVEETRLSHGMRSFGSMRGVSSHQHNPFAAITLGPPSETTGEVKGFALVYSGNFLVEAELNEMGRLRFNMGIHPMGLQWFLKPGDFFETPEAVLVRSGDGLGGMSRMMHRVVLDRLIPKNWSDHDPPVLLNTWEAKYFHVNHNNVVDMAKMASKVGINMIVLDDGWFGNRDNDRCSLGDWVANLDKFPYGIKGLVDDVNAAGCKFGIWIEPEMVSEESMLFTSHPDWYFHVPGRPRQIGRNQMVLDLSRKDVRDYLFNCIASVLGGANVEYVKWDMNRPLTEVYSMAAGLGEVWQAEVAHRYVLGVYDLQQRLVTSFPRVLFENCASGGGRFDLGMLYFSPQIWCSDNTDALVRLRVQYGTSLAYPARTMGAHVSTVPNHLTGNTTSLRTRAAVALCGTFGYELDISVCSSSDLLAFQRQIDLYKEISPVIRWGELYRLWDPFKVNYAAWMYVSRDKSDAVVFAFCMNSDHWSNLVPRLVLQGLISGAEYEVTEPFPSNITQQSTGSVMIIESEVPMYQLGVGKVLLTGAILMNAGLPIKFYSSDDCAVFRLKKIPNTLTKKPKKIAKEN